MVGMFCRLFGYDMLNQCAILNKWPIFLLFHAHTTSEWIKIFSYNSIKLSMCVAICHGSCVCLHTSHSVFIYTHPDMYSFKRDGTFQTNEEHRNMYKCPQDTDL